MVYIKYINKFNFLKNLNILNCYKNKNNIKKKYFDKYYNYIFSIKKFFLNKKFIQILTPILENNCFNYKLLNIIKTDNFKETFYCKKKILRTHTSCIQNRFFKNFNSKIKIFNLGQVFRNDFDKTHLFSFNQLDYFLTNNFCLKKNLNLILNFLSFLFKKKFFYKIRKVKFPFTIISYEIDILYNNFWLEIIGFGIINKNIFLNNFLKLKGLACGIGIDRIYMIKKKKKHIKYIYD